MYICTLICQKYCVVFTSKSTPFVITAMHTYTYTYMRLDLIFCYFSNFYLRWICLYYILNRTQQQQKQKQKRQRSTVRSRTPSAYTGININTYSIRNNYKSEIKTFLKTQFTYKRISFSSNAVIWSVYVL